MRNEGLENMILTVRIEGTNDSGKHRITLTILLKMMVGQAVRFIAGGYTLLRSSKDIDITNTSTHTHTYTV